MDSATNVSFSTVRIVLKIDMNLPLFKKSKSQMSLQAGKSKSFCWAKFHLKNLKDGTQHRVLWVDERLFTKKAIHLRQNSQIFAVNKENISLNEWNAYKCQKSVPLMVCDGVTSTGKKIPSSLLYKGSKPTNMLIKICWNNNWFLESL